MYRCVTLCVTAIPLKEINSLIFSTVLAPITPATPVPTHPSKKYGYPRILHMFTNVLQVGILN